MVYDSTRGRVILFGGADEARVRGDTWEWDGKRWRQLTSLGPAPRNHTAMVYDSKRKIIILFGGHDFGLEDSVNVFGDTWEWLGVEWVKKEGVNPLKRVDNGH